MNKLMIINIVIFIIVLIAVHNVSAYTFSDGFELPTHFEIFNSVNFDNITPDEFINIIENNEFYVLARTKFINFDTALQMLNSNDILATLELKSSDATVTEYDSLLNNYFIIFSIRTNFSNNDECSVEGYTINFNFVTNNFFKDKFTNNCYIFYYDDQSIPAYITSYYIYNNTIIFFGPFTLLGGPHQYAPRDFLLFYIEKPLIFKVDYDIDYKNDRIVVYYDKDSKTLTFYDYKLDYNTKTTKLYKYEIQFDLGIDNYNFTYHPQFLSDFSSQEELSQFYRDFILKSQTVDNTNENNQNKLKEFYISLTFDNYLIDKKVIINDVKVYDNSLSLIKEIKNKNVRSFKITLSTNKIYELNVDCSIKIGQKVLEFNKSVYFYAKSNDNVIKIKVNIFKEYFAIDLKQSRLKFNSDKLLLAQYVFTNETLEAQYYSKDDSIYVISHQNKYCYDSKTYTETLNSIILNKVDCSEKHNIEVYEILFKDLSSLIQDVKFTYVYFNKRDNKLHFLIPENTIENLYIQIIYSNDDFSSIMYLPKESFTETIQLPDGTNITVFKYVVYDSDYLQIRIFKQLSKLTVIDMLKLDKGRTVIYDDVYKSIFEQNKPYLLLQSDYFTKMYEFEGISIKGEYIILTNVNAEQYDNLLYVVSRTSYNTMTQFLKSYFILIILFAVVVLFIVTRNIKVTIVVSALIMLIYSVISFSFIYTALSILLLLLTVKGDEE